MSDRFREMSKCIFSSLDIEKALFDAYTYLKGTMPLDGAFITSYDYTQQKARLIAFAFEEGGFGLDEIVPLSDETWEMMGEWHSESLRDPTPWIRDHNHPINKEFMGLVKRGVPSIKANIKGIHDHCCTISCALKNKNSILCTVVRDLLICYPFWSGCYLARSS